MFGRNGKISERQIRRILILEQAAKIGLLLPLLAQIPEGGFSVRIWCLMAVLLAGYLKLMLDFARKIQIAPSGNLKSGSENNMPKKAAIFLTAVYCLYGFANVFLLLQMFAQVTQYFLLPEQKTWILILVSAAVSSFAADHRLEIRAKFLEVLCPVLVFPVVLLLLILAVLTVRGGQFGTLGEMLYASDKGTVAGTGVGMFTVFAGLGCDVFLQKETKEGERERTFRKTTGGMLIGSFLLLFLLQAIFGAGGIRALPFPIITAMSNSKIRGIFLQRWDVLFATLFLGMICGALVPGFANLDSCGGKLLPGKKKRWKSWFMTASAAAAACISPSYEKSVRLYVIVSFCFLAGSALAALLSLARIKSGERRKKGSV